MGKNCGKMNYNSFFFSCGYTGNIVSFIKLSIELKQIKIFNKNLQKYFSICYCRNIHIRGVFIEIKRGVTWLPDNKKVFPNTFCHGIEDFRLNLVWVTDRNISWRTNV